MATAQLLPTKQKNSKNPTHIIITATLGLLLLTVIIHIALSPSRESKNGSCLIYSNEEFIHKGFLFDYNECILKNTTNIDECQQYNDSYSELIELTKDSLISNINECFWDPVSTKNENKNRIGRLSLINDNIRKSALSLIKKGQILDLGHIYNESFSNDLQERYVETRINLLDESITINFESNAYGNLGTQFDGVGHVFYKPENYCNDPSKWIFYNNFRGDIVLNNNLSNIPNMIGVNQIGIQYTESFVVRGILLDLPRALYNNDSLPEYYEITTNDIKKGLEFAKITNINVGDVIFIYTGWYYKTLENLYENVFKIPYLSKTLINDYIADTGIIGIGADILPDPTLGPSAIHQTWIICQGGFILEFVNLEEWIENIRINHEFPTIAALFYSPWRVQGGVGSPGQPFIMY